MLQARISLYPDFSAEVQKSRARFTTVKQCLQKLQALYAMLYPAKLRVTVGSQTYFFERATDASPWFDANEHIFRPVGTAEDD